MASYHKTFSGIVDYTSGTITDSGSAYNIYTDWQPVKGLTEVGVFWRLNSVNGGAVGGTGHINLIVEHSPTGDANIKKDLDLYRHPAKSTVVGFTTVDGEVSTSVYYYRYAGIPAGYIRIRRKVWGTTPSISHDFFINSA